MAMRYSVMVILGSHTVIILAFRPIEARLLAVRCAGNFAADKCLFECARLRASRGLRETRGSAGTRLLVECDSPQKRSAGVTFVP
jgi:hypothetical protein